MSTTGNPGLPRATPEALAFLANRGPDPNEDMAAFLDHAVASNKVMGSPAHPADPETVRQNARRTFERSFYPVGFSRQYAAITASPDRRPKLAKLTVPTVVIHGEADPLVPVEGGRDTAANIAGAELITIPGVGHDLPPARYDEVIGGILRVVERSKATA
jgi:pimeloyl-ACP methyl ester carboxylesterase